MFFGLGADGTVGANKNSIKIIGEETDRYAQGYFVYDSKKSGATTISHLRFEPAADPLGLSDLARRSFVACHQFEFLERVDVLEHAAAGAVFLLNAPYGPDEVWDRLPREVQEQLIDKRLRFYVIDASAVARETGMGGRINTIMQTCFFAISGVLPREEAIAQIKHAIEKTYSKQRRRRSCKRNFAAVDRDARPPARGGGPGRRHRDARAVRRWCPTQAPDFVQRVTAVLLAGKGDLLPVSAFPVDGTWPVGTAKWEKRNLALGDPGLGPGSASSATSACWSVRTRPSGPRSTNGGPLAGAPPTFKSVPYKGLEFKGWKYTIQVAPEDCTGCNLCVMVCPAKDKTNPRHKAIDMHPQAPLRDAERENYAFFLDLPDTARVDLPKSTSRRRSSSSRCSSTPGRAPAAARRRTSSCSRSSSATALLMANATGCSSIYGGNLPTTPYTTNRDGRGPAWSNSLFEDNAEFGLGLRLGVDSHARAARALVRIHGRADRRAPRRRAARRRPVDGSGHPGAARAGARAATDARGRSPRPRRAASKRSPTTS